jgi:hypothetical protein
MFRARRATQKRLHFESETIIATAFALQESLTLARWSFQRRVVEPLDLAPACGVHGLVVVPVFYIELSSASRLTWSEATSSRFAREGRLLAPQPSHLRDRLRVLRG